MPEGRHGDRACRKNSGGKVVINQVQNNFTRCVTISIHSGGNFLFAFFPRTVSTSDVNIHAKYFPKQN